jgi:prepilin-type N-terminal cleavage/methylation domain-containing protein
MKHHHRWSGRRGRRGLTLVEVVLAVAILGIGMAVLLTAASRCLAVMRVARNYQEAQWVLGQALADYPLDPTNDVEELVIDEVEIVEGFRFSRDVDEDEDEDGLYVVRSRVTWADRGRQNTEEVLQLVYQPEEEE